MKIRPTVWLNAALALPALLSLYAGIRNSLARSSDFQWSGANLALHHIDPYRQFLLHDPDHLILLSQVPNYLHELYLLLLPLGAMSFAAAKPVWAVLNLVFAVISTLLLGHLYRLDRATTLLLALLLLASTPFRVVLGNGQQSLLELLFFCLIFSTSTWLGRGVSLGLSYFKYSFSPIVFLYFLFRGKYRTLAISAVPPLIGFLALLSLVHGTPLTLLTEPFAVNRVGVTSGLGDLMSLIFTATYQRFGPDTVRHLMYAPALLLSVACAIWLSRRPTVPRSHLQDFAPIAVANLLLFTHLTYDFVFLAVPLAACLASSFAPSSPSEEATPSQPFFTVRRAAALTIIALLWYAIRIAPNPTLPLPLFLLKLAVFLLLATLLVLINPRQKDAVQVGQSDQPC